MGSRLMPQFLLILQQWGPWFLMAWGLVLLFASTVLYDFQIRLLGKLFESQSVLDHLNNPRIPAYHRNLIRWMIGSVQTPWMQWLSIVWS